MYRKGEGKLLINYKIIQLILVLLTISNIICRYSEQNERYSLLYRPLSLEIFKFSAPTRTYTPNN